MYSVPIQTKPLSYAEACEALTLQLRIGIDPVLETVIEMLDALGNPQSYFDVIQIGGTNGKTSTSRYTAAFLEAALRDSNVTPENVPLVGLYTSPELERVNERIALDGEDVPDELFATGVAAAQAAGEKVNHNRLLAGESLYNITQFDLLTVAALVIFALKDVKVAVLEVGMGGRWDATTATNPLITAITGVDLDHTKILGETKAQIAQEKAAIIKPGQRVFLGSGVAGDSEVRAIIDARCAACAVEPDYVPAQMPLEKSLSAKEFSSEGLVEKEISAKEISTKTLPAKGLSIKNPSAKKPPKKEEAATDPSPQMFSRAHIPHYQATNIALAKAIAEAYLQRSLSPQTTVGLLEKMLIPGRFEILSKTPLHIIDAAHNPQSVRVSMNELRAFQATHDKPIGALLAMFADKDTEMMAALIANSLDPRADIYVTQTKNDRCLSAVRLGEMFSALGRAPARIFESVPEACDTLVQEDYIAIGTITLAGEVKTFEKNG